MARAKAIPGRRAARKAAKPAAKRAGSSRKAGSIFASLRPGRANFAPLTPVSFLARTAAIHPDRLAVVHGAQRFSYRQLEERARRLASALARHGVRPGDTVSAMLPNVPAMLEAHFGVPMAGAVLNAINTRLDAATVAYILEHGEAKVLITDREYAAQVGPALARLKRPPLVVDVDDPLYSGPGNRLGRIEYEDFIASGDPAFVDRPVLDESGPLALNYTSGTTGNPKGVVYHHRGTFLEAVGNTMAWPLPPKPVYLWTLPMFHCNGWCFPWSVTAMGGTHVCLRRVDPALIFAMIVEHGVTHMCGAPTVLGMLVGAPAEQRRRFDHIVDIQTGGSPPPAKVIKAMEELGFRVTHIYGMTELQGPSTLCVPQDRWADLPLEERAAFSARQGVRYPVVEAQMVADPKTLEPVARDGASVGEIMVRGNTVMLGYLKQPKATAEAFRGGWMHTGDLAVEHPDGYVEIKDRAKDIIISGGENISSVEVEIALYKHPAVALAAVVAKPDEKWGETPCAFVQLKPGAEASAAEIIAFCRDQLAHYKAPKSVVFGTLPTTATGKIQKFVLREQVRAAARPAGGMRAAAGPAR
ncbi:MAG: long-chain-fatty-acid--CoA ligase [Alphaproteobacteria bacterium]|nr:long-chain-fatty-acid--CoA ligase [Alphaproteobacteria bacterium]MCW5742501.1 long-chain-fatty-acid--CoA ligase [Alphaproteobacteria bacterium]